MECGEGRRPPEMECGEGRRPPEMEETAGDGKDGKGRTCFFFSGSSLNPPSHPICNQEGFSNFFSSFTIITPDLDANVSFKKRFNKLPKMSGDSDDISSVRSPPLPLDLVPQAMLRSLVNHNHRFLEENMRLQARLEIYQAKMERKKKKLEDARMLEKSRKKEYYDLTQKLWDEKLVVQKLEKTVKYLKGRCPCNR
ncbi:hypothetical protein L6452_06644 [Arctium lappa]|uniref:Uncharacterized protein n=1 Tax=Arctium lappa TaxID=4217 RepID=A0ACB9EKU0_ARCLA|nr:hypothetical protein L6452_06644 [Arctium lappa]